MGVGVLSSIRASAEVCLFVCLWVVGLKVVITHSVQDRCVSVVPAHSPPLPSPLLQLDVLALLLLSEVVQSCLEDSEVWLPVLRQHAILLQVVHIMDRAVRVSGCAAVL